MNEIVETIKLLFLAIELNVLVIIVYLIQYQDNKSKSKKVVGF